MKRIIFTDEQIKDILGLYQDKSVKLADICNKHHVSLGTLMNIVDENNIPRRQKLSKRIKTKKCGHCGAKVDLKGAKFCPFCGHNIMTESEQLIEELRDKISLLELLPSTERDDFRNVLLKAINYIKEKCRDTE